MIARLFFFLLMPILFLHVFVKGFAADDTISYESLPTPVSIPSVAPMPPAPAPCRTIYGCSFISPAAPNTIAAPMPPNVQIQQPDFPMESSPPSSSLSLSTDTDTSANNDGDSIAADQPSDAMIPRPLPTRSVLLEPFSLPTPTPEVAPPVPVRSKVSTPAPVPPSLRLDDIDNLLHVMKNPLDRDRFIAQLEIMRAALDTQQKDTHRNLLIDIRKATVIKLSQLNANAITSFVDLYAILSKPDTSFPIAIAPHIFFFEFIPSLILVLFVIFSFAYLLHFLLQRLFKRFQLPFHLKYRRSLWTIQEPLFLLYLNFLSFVTSYVIPGAVAESTFAFAVAYTYFMLVHLLLHYYFHYKTSYRSFSLNVWIIISALCIFFLLLHRIGAFSIYAGTLILLFSLLLFFFSSIFLIVRHRHAFSYFLRHNPYARPYIFLRTLSAFIGRHFLLISLPYIALLPICTLVWRLDGVIYYLRSTLFSGLLFFFLFALYAAIIKTDLVWLQSSSAPLERKKRIHTHRLFFYIFLFSYFLGLLYIWSYRFLIFLISTIDKTNMATLYSLTKNSLILLAFWVVFNYFIQRRILMLSKANKIVASNRLKSLYPLLKQIFIIIAFIYVVFIILKSFQLEITTLIASLGTLGVVVGIVAQKEVQNFFAATQFLMSNYIAIGDSICIDSYKGTVEKVGMRTIFLRDIEGQLYIIPFNTITNLIHRARDFSFAVIEFTIPHDIPLPSLNTLFQDISGNLRRNPDFMYMILDDLELYNYEFTELGIAIKVRIKTRGGDQWEVRRALQQAIQHCFFLNNIPFSLPQRILHGEIHKTP